MFTKSEVNRNCRGGSASLRTATLVALFGLFVAPAYSQTTPAVPAGSCGPMDVVFVIDTTGSMQGAIDNIKSALTTSNGIIPAIVNASGEDFVSSAEARLGLVVVNGRSEPTFDGQQYDCMITDSRVPVPQGLLGDCIIVVRDLGAGATSISDVENSIANLPPAAGGGGPAEITTEALRTVLQGVDQTPDVVGGPAPQVTPPAVISGSANDFPRLQWNNWNGTFRSGAKKVVFLVTDNVPGGSDGVFDPLVDGALAAQMAADYATAGITIQPILVQLQGYCMGPGAQVRLIDDANPQGAEITTAQCVGGGGTATPAQFHAQAETIMQTYADATGGMLTKVPFDGNGTALSIVSVIEECGGDIPKTTQGRMTGGGSIFHENNRRNPRVTHGFTLRCDGGPNNLEVNWSRHRFHLETVTEITCLDFPELDEQNPVAGFDTIKGSGTGRLNGVSGATIKFTFVDDGEPGKVSDTATMTISDANGVVLEVTGTIEKGNHQAHW